MASDFKNYHDMMREIFPFRLDEKGYELFAHYFEKNYLKHMPENKDAKVLEIACGMGQFLFFLKKNGFKNIEAIDLDPNNVNQCKSLGFSTVVEADMYDYVMKVDGSTYDLIVMNDLIEHIPREDVVNFLSALRGKLKDGGALIIKTNNCNNMVGVSAYFADFTHVMGYTSERIKHVSMLSSFSSCSVFNLFVLPKIKYIDGLVKFLWITIFKAKKMFFLVNAKMTDGVFSKNLLAVLYK